MRIFIPGLLFLVLLLAACGGAATPTSTVALPTPTLFPTYQFVMPTAPPQLATARATSAPAVEPALDAQAVERGRGRYEALECGKCHGDQGEGTDDGSALTDFAMSLEEFVSFMRSGGSLGSDHQYSTNRLSDTGGRNLYQYLLSLQADTGS